MKLTPSWSLTLFAVCPVIESLSKCPLIYFLQSVSMKVSANWFSSISSLVSNSDRYTDWTFSMLSIQMTDILSTQLPDRFFRCATTGHVTVGGTRAINLKQKVLTFSEMAAMPFPWKGHLLCCVNIPTVLLMFFNKFAGCSIPYFNLSYCKKNCNFLRCHFLFDQTLQKKFSIKVRREDRKSSTSLGFVDPSSLDCSIWHSFCSFF